MVDYGGTTIVHDDYKPTNKSLGPHLGAIYFYRSTVVFASRSNPKKDSDKSR